MSLFLCPICGQQLQREKGRYVCPLRHSYDIASAGYVHPASSQQKALADTRGRQADGSRQKPLSERGVVSSAAGCDCCCGHREDA